MWARYSGYFHSNWIGNGSLNECIGRMPTMTNLPVLLVTQDQAEDPAYD